jgi:hypothetical protein
MHVLCLSIHICLKIQCGHVVPDTVLKNAGMRAAVSYFTDEKAKRRVDDAVDLLNKSPNVPALGPLLDWLEDASVSANKFLCSQDLDELETIRRMFRDEHLNPFIQISVLEVKTQKAETPWQSSGWHS